LSDQLSAKHERSAVGPHLHRHEYGSHRYSRLVDSLFRLGVVGETNISARPDENQQRENAMIDTRDTLSRRDFLRNMTAAGLATLAGGEPRPVHGAEQVTHPKPTADTCILLWMAGGMAAPETVDPKRYTPFEVGVPSEKILCTFP